MCRLYVACDVEVVVLECELLIGAIEQRRIESLEDDARRRCEGIAQCGELSSTNLKWERVWEGGDERKAGGRLSDNQEGGR